MRWESFESSTPRTVAANSRPLHQSAPTIAANGKLPIQQLFNRKVCFLWQALFLQDLAGSTDLPDPRDNTPADIAGLLAELKPLPERPAQVDWREYCPAVDDQQGLASSAAHACAALLQYFERRAHGAVVEPSRLFMHLTSRRLALAAEGCPSLRTTWKAVARFGAVPEAHFPYDPCGDAEPSPFAYGFSREYQSLRYVRIDSRDNSGEETLLIAQTGWRLGLRSYLAYRCIRRSLLPQKSPFPRGSMPYAVVRRSWPWDTMTTVEFARTRGRFLIRNSWGAAWGDAGYGWLPYSYVRRQFGVDFWTIVKPEWITSDDFHRPTF